MSNENINASLSNALAELKASRQRVAEQDRIIAAWKAEKEAWHERCAHFERLSGAIRQATVEECAKVCDEWVDSGMPAAFDHSSNADEARLQCDAACECATAIRALSAPKDRRSGGERRIKFLDPVDGRYASDRRVNVYPRRQP